MNSNSNLKKIAVIFGGYSSEYKVSLHSVYSVLTNLDTKKYEFFQSELQKRETGSVIMEITRKFMTIHGQRIRKILCQL